MPDEKMSAVIYELTPEQMGWLSLGNRAWRKPDGSIYQFPPSPNREVIAVYITVPPGEIFHLERAV